VLRRGLALTVAAVCATALWADSARGDPKTECFDDASRGQTLRDEHKLVDARAAFAVCARQICPKQVSKDCTAWLDQVEEALPTVVVSASDPAGRDRLDVTVLLDGHPFATKLTGQAVPVDPGVHTFHFETADGSRLDHPMLVREGVKNQAVAVVLAPGATVGTAATGTVSVGAGAASSVGDRDLGTAPASVAVPWRTVGFVAGGIGIAAVGLGAVFGFIALGDKNAAQCDATGACKPGPLGDARGAATIATVGFVAGGALLAGGAALVLLAPTGHAGESTPPSRTAARSFAGLQSLRIAPAVTPRETGLQVAGSW
jgi:hypothetical protein